MVTPTQYAILQISGHEGKAQCSACTQIRSTGCAGNIGFVHYLIMRRGVPALNSMSAEAADGRLGVMTGLL